ncbi:hypothetical protein AZ34_05275 [Hylemonella gracilis str. Niagara R]|uniref:Uncharacterized protein n=1 Tax=Hylemonella gracilis str. Niagara R TaxID=1458275 RepID=A0A016XEP1_9BURK|nr:hypothetical protein [Hylemonella gracilis]EYC50529.1 hypothetical protein AZ34_05275 [Hylemonella gracilis str. Niagara R]
MNSARLTKRRLALRLKPPAPRNPLVAPALKRKAGAHRKTAKSERQAGRQALRQALKQVP